jgi:hypothetical protein
VRQLHPSKFQTIIMDYSELQFILANREKEGFISVGDAAEYYKMGVQNLLNIIVIVLVLWLE